MLEFLMNGGGIWWGIGGNFWYCFGICIKVFEGYVLMIGVGIFCLGRINLVWFLMRCGCMGCVDSWVVFGGVWCIVDLLVVNLLIEKGYWLLGV